MADNVEFVTARLAAMWGEITGITRAHAQLPRTLNSTDVPAVLIFPRAVQDRKISGGPKRNVTEQRLFDMVLCVAQAALGDATQGQIAIEPYFARVNDHFLARPGLELDADSPQTQVVFDAELGLDSGYIRFPYATGDGEKPYHAINFPIQVEYRYAVVMKG